MNPNENRFFREKSKSKKWLIISWKHDDLMDGAYGRHIDDFEGTYEDAAIYARQFVHNYSPVGVVGVIDATE